MTKKCWSLHSVNPQLLWLADPGISTRLQLMPCRTREEREAAYQEARARIFGEEAPAKAPSPSPSSVSLDRAGTQEAVPAASQHAAGKHFVELAMGVASLPSTMSWMH